MRFVNSYILWTLIFVPVLWILVFFFTKSSRKKLIHSGDINILTSSFSSISLIAGRHRVFFELFIIVFLILAYAGPQYGYRDQYVVKKSSDIVFCVDVSNSMLVKDVKPSRLKKAGHLIRSFLDRLTGERASLVVFAGEAFIQCPLTIDYEALVSFASELTPSLIPVPGTSLSKAVYKAMDVFDFSQAGKKIIVIITDGEDHDRNIDQAINEALEKNVTIYTIGVGTANGEPVPNIDKDGQISDYLKDSNGNIVVSRLNDQLLQKVSSSTGGAFYQATPLEVEVNKIISEFNDNGVGKSKVKTIDAFVHRYQYPLFIVMVLLLILIFGSWRKKDEI